MIVNVFELIFYLYLYYLYNEFKFEKCLVFRDKIRIWKFY